MTTNESAIVNDAQRPSIINITKAAVIEGKLREDKLKNLNRSATAAEYI
jgi:hypothetical protein